MGSGENSTLRPLASQPLAENDSRFGCGLRRWGANRAELSVTHQHHGSGISDEAWPSDISHIVYEFYKEDVSNRAQARKFLWEFFD
jgi:hypothetical protein